MGHCVAVRGHVYTHPVPTVTRDASYALRRGLCGARKRPRPDSESWAENAPFFYSVSQSITYIWADLEPIFHDS